MASVLNSLEAGGVDNAVGSSHVTLLKFESQIIDLKCFKNEFRAKKDVNCLARDGAIILDLDETNLEVIINRMLDSISLGNQQKAEVFGSLFSVDDCSNFDVTFITSRLQSIQISGSDSFLDQNWLLLYTDVNGITGRKLSITRLKHPVNFGPSLEEVTFVILILSSNAEKPSKSSLETSKSFATVFAFPQNRLRLSQIQTEGDFKEELINISNELEENKKEKDEIKGEEEEWWPGKGIRDDFRRRWKCYKDDYLDGIRNARDVQKTLSAAVFLYFSVLPTAIALGMLNDQNTNGKINVKKEILSQIIGGLWFGLLGGQLFLVMLSTAPISIYIEVIQQLSLQYNLDFFKIYTMTGIWCSFFLIVSAILEFSKLMKYARRSLEELFGLFISLALIIRSCKALFAALINHPPQCLDGSLEYEGQMPCSRSSGLMFLILLFGTFIVSFFFYRFRVSCYLSRLKRELLADYSLPIGVLLISLIYLLLFQDIRMQSFSYDDDHHPPITVTFFLDQSVVAHLISFLLGIPLAVLFFMDQLIVTNTVDNNQNKLKKGSASNWDLVIVAIMNIFLSILGLPWMHGALPQAFMHLKALADVEDRIIEGRMDSSIVKNRETRCATLLAHLLMIPTYLFLLPYLKLIPTAVFHGLFIYLAITSMDGNELVDRMSLMFTEQRLYPPFHYLRRVPQKIVHLFTTIEFLQLVVLVVVGHAPWPAVELAFPVITFLFIPFNYLIVPKVIDPHYLNVLDGVH
ncbi:unnamed protein product [Bursaphelenchus xylophilus]|uniref:(pine wood nematode) hypothetical protein n=1 Tax=Bursaphelenchus xylophilus TaxID=6326 RepID=A0A1I7RRU8_BURXY|nr:unnamed protein product [Bursaphelenchus xylophilus]CAG9123462.1 unnamed protein product [Bursaphelenchus xylophilus]